VAIAGIVIGAVSVLITFVSVIGLVRYHRRKLLGMVMKRNSKIDGKFQKTELKRRVTGVYELDSNREIQEADGRMIPAELAAI
jgi:hypothetical protein